jgi:hypothetical protein
MDTFVRVALFVALLFAFAAPADAQSARLVSVTTPRGAKQAFILIKPQKPVASVILFAGGHGALGLQSATSMNWGAKNFLVRSRDLFASRDLMVAVVDAPSDQPKGMNAIFRMTGAHAGDINAVAAFLKKEASVPVWLVGTSMGTFSAAAGAIGAKNVDGLVLTSSITRSQPHWKIARSYRKGIASLPLPKVTVPTLIVAHKNDGCKITPASDVPMLRNALAKAKPIDVVLLSGGDPPRSDPCNALSQHGFLGIEKQAVDAVAKFITANTK